MPRPFLRWLSRSLSAWSARWTQSPPTPSTRLAVRPQLQRAEDRTPPGNILGGLVGAAWASQWNEPIEQVAALVGDWALVGHTSEALPTAATTEPSVVPLHWALAEAEWSPDAPPTAGGRGGVQTMGPALFAGGAFVPEWAEADSVSGASAWSSPPGTLGGTGSAGEAAGRESGGSGAGAPSGGDSHGGAGAGTPSGGSSGDRAGGVSNLSSQSGVAPVNAPKSEPLTFPPSVFAAKGPPNPNPAQIQGQGNKLASADAPNGLVEGQNYTFTVATFTVTSPTYVGELLPVDFTAQVAWGDGQTRAGRVEAIGVNDFKVVADHTYQHFDWYTTKTTVQFETGAVPLTPGTIQIVDAALTADSYAPQFLVGTPFDDAVAFFTDANPYRVASDFTATIDWGHGNGPVPGQVRVAPSGQVEVRGQTTYPDPNNYTVQVELFSVGGASASQTFPAQATVGAWTATAEPITATAGVMESWSVATLRAETTNLTGTQLNATIDWGDGSSPTTTTLNASGSSVAVEGSHRYDQAGVYPVTITATDSVSGVLVASATTSALARTGSLFNVAPVAVAEQVEGTWFHAKVATITDPPHLASTGYSAWIEWGDGRMSPGSVSYDSLTEQYWVEGSGHYERRDKGTYTATVHVLDADGRSATTTTGIPVADRKITASAVSIYTDDRMTVYGWVGSFSSNAFDLSKGHSVQINWGDGQRTPAEQILGPGDHIAKTYLGLPQFDYKQYIGSATANPWWGGSYGSIYSATGAADYSVYGSHAYAAGEYEITIEVTDSATGQVVTSPPQQVFVAEYKEPEPVKDRPFPPVKIDPHLSVAVHGPSAVEGKEFAGVIATVVDSLPPQDDNPPQGVAVTIDWGDGSQPSSVWLAPGETRVYAQHTWAVTDTYPIRVVAFAPDNNIGVDEIGDPQFEWINSGQNFADGSAEVAEAPFVDTTIQATGQSLSGSEGTAIPGSTIVARFTCADPEVQASDFIAYVWWGDETEPTLGTISNGSGGFVVRSGHTYQRPGQFGVNVFVVRKPDDLSEVPLPGSVGWSYFWSWGWQASDTVITTASIADPPLQLASGASASWTANVATTQLLATFTDADPGAELVDYTATIYWGDSTGGEVVPVDVMGEIRGTHTYAHPGRYTQRVVLSDGTQSVARDHQVVVDPLVVLPPELLGLQVDVPRLEVTEDHWIGDTPDEQWVATVIYPAGQPPRGEQVTVDWGDGHTNVARLRPLAGVSGQYQVLTNHRYTEAGIYPLVVSLSGCGEPVAGYTTAVVADVALTAELAVSNLQVPAGGWWWGSYYNNLNYWNTGWPWYTFQGDDFRWGSGWWWGNNLGWDATVAPLALARFTDPSAEAASAYSATIAWGDGSTETAQIMGSGGTYYVVGAPRFAVAGKYDFRVTISDGPLNTTAVTGQIQVTDTAVNDPTSFRVGTARNHNPLDQMITTNINWGSQPSVETRLGDPTDLYYGGWSSYWGNAYWWGYYNSFLTGSWDYTVYGSQAYPTPGTFAISANLTDRAPQSVTLQRHLSVAAAPLQILGVRNELTTVTGTAVADIPVGLFIDRNYPTQSEYTVDVDWGDGSDPTVGTVSSTGAQGHTFSLGAHTYSEIGTYAVTIQLRNRLGARATVGTTITVADGDWALALDEVAAVTGQPFSAVRVATLTDPEAAFATAGSSTELQVWVPTIPTANAATYFRWTAPGNGTDPTFEWAYTATATWDGGTVTSATVRPTYDPEEGKVVPGVYEVWADGQAPGARGRTPLSVQVTKISDFVRLSDQPGFGLTADHGQGWSTPWQGQATPAQSEAEQGFAVTLGTAAISPYEGGLRLAHELDFDQSPGRGLGGSPALVYDLASADPRPIIGVNLANNPAEDLPVGIDVRLKWAKDDPTAWQALSVPSHYSAQAPLSVAVQVAAPVKHTGHYPWQVDVKVRYQDAPTTYASYSGFADVIARTEEADAPLGVGWGLAGVDRLHLTCHGVLWEYGSGGSRYFTGQEGILSGPPQEFGELKRNEDKTFTYTATDASKWKFDTQGLLRSVTDLHGLARTYDYDGQGRLTTVQAIDGGVTTLQYPGGGVQIFQPGGRLVNLGFTNTRDVNLISGGGFTRGFGYQNHRLDTDSWHPQMTTIGYSPSGQVVSVDLGQGTTYRLIPQVRTTVDYYETVRSQPTATLSNAFLVATDYRLDAGGRLLRTTRTDGSVEHSAYDAAGQLVSFTDARGAQTQYAYDYSETGKGQVSVLTNPDGTTRAYSYHTKSHRLERQLDENGHETKWSYNDAGDLLAVEDATGVTTNYYYDAAPGLVTQETRSYVTTFYTYDAQRRLQTRRVPFGPNGTGGITTFGYDGAGHLLWLRDPNQKTTNYTYDNRELLQETLYPDLTSTETSYYYNGMVYSTTDELQRVTRYVIDSRGLTTGVIENFQKASARTTTYAYDAAQRKTQVQTGASAVNPFVQVTTYQYNDLDQVKTITTGANSTTPRVTQLTYDLSGNLYDQVDALGMWSTTRSDARGQTRHTQEARYSDWERWTHTTHDQAGNVLSVRSNWDKVHADLNFPTTRAYQYDAANRQTHQWEAFATPDQRVTVTGYDNAGQVETITRPGDVVTKYVYNDAGWVTDRYEAYGNAAFERRYRSSYDGAGNLIDATDPLGVRTKSVYDDRYRVKISIEAYNTPRERRSEFEYDLVGNLTVTTTGLASKSDYQFVQKSVAEFDDFDRQTKLTTAAGTTQPLVQTFAYNAADLRTEHNTGIMSSTPGVPWVVTRSEYTLLGELRQQTEAAGTTVERTTTWAYDNGGRMTLQTTGAAPNAQYAFPVTTKTNFDLLGRAVVVTEAFGTVDARQTVAKYNSADLQIEQTTGIASGPRHHPAKSTYTYDQLGRQITVIDPRGKTHTTGYDAQDNITVTVSPDTTTTYDYTPLGELKASLNPEGYLAYRKFDAAGRVSEEGDFAGQVTTYQYDELGRRTEVKVGNAPPTKYAYNAADLQTAVTTPQQKTTHMGYDPRGRLRSTTDPYNRVTYYDYIPETRMTMITDASQLKTRIWVDELGRESKRRDPAVLITERSYDAADHVIQLKDNASQNSTYEFDKLGNQTYSRDIAGVEVRTGYDAAGNLIRVEESTTPSYTNVTTYEYNAANQRTKMTDPLGAFSTWEYDAAGRLTGSTDRNGRRIERQYDGAGRQQYEFWYQPDGSLNQLLSFDYDAEGRLTEATNATGTVSLTRNSRGWVTSESDVFQTKLTHQYNDEGQRTQTTDEYGGQTQYTYDHTGRPQSLQFRKPGTPQDPGIGVRFFYQAGGQLQYTDYTSSAAAAAPNSQGLTDPTNLTGVMLITTQGYGAGGRVERRAFSKPGQPGAFDSQTVKYDDLNRLRQLTNTNSSDPTQTTTLLYNFDAAGQISRVVAQLCRSRTHPLIGFSVMPLGRS